MKGLGAELVAAWGIALLAVGCTDPVDRAAKKRIFSPEDPPKVVASAAEKLSSERMAEDAPAAQRILSMTAAEATERLRGFSFTARVRFEWTGAGQDVKLEEERTLVAGPGGVGGDFLARVDLNKDQGLEVLRVGGKVYARNRHGKFRLRLRDRGMAERKREEVFGALAEVNELFSGRMQLTSSGTVSHQRRAAWKYLVTLAPEGSHEEAKGNLPPIPRERDGSDETTARRLAFRQKRVLRSLTGDLWVDAETGVVLQTKLEGALSVKGKEKEEASLKLELAATVGDIGKDPALAAPKEFLPDEDKPPGIADALSRFGIPRTVDRPDAGEASEVPDDEG